MVGELVLRAGLEQVVPAGVQGPQWALGPLRRQVQEQGLALLKGMWGSDPVLGPLQRRYSRGKLN